MGFVSAFTPITESAAFLTVCIDPGGEEVAKELLPDLGGLRRSVGFRATEARLGCIVGIGSELWDRLFAPTSSTCASNWRG